MVAMTLTARLASLTDWPGHLFDATGSTGGDAILVQNATSFTFRHGMNDDQFPGYRSQVTGTGFT